MVVAQATSGSPGQSPAESPHREWAESLRELFDRYVAGVYDFLCLLVMDPAAAELLLEELFGRQLLTTRPPKGDVEAWVYTLAWQVSQDFLRSPGWNLGPVLPPELVAKAPEAQPLLEAIWAAAAKLSPRERLALILAESRDWNPRTAAALLGVRLSQVSENLEQGIAAFQSALDLSSLPAEARAIPTFELAHQWGLHPRMPAPYTLYGFLPEFSLSSEAIEELWRRVLELATLSRPTGLLRRRPGRGWEWGCGCTSFLWGLTLVLSTLAILVTLFALREWLRGGQIEFLLAGPTPVTGSPPPPWTPTPITVAVATPRPTCVSIPSDWVPYVVRTGDTLYDLAARRATTVDLIIYHNCLPPDYILQTGDLLYLPPEFTPTPLPPPTATPRPSPTPTYTPLPTSTPTLTPTPCGCFFPGWDYQLLPATVSIQELIVQRHTNERAVLLANCLTDLRAVRPGQRLCLPVRQVGVPQLRSPVDVAVLQTGPVPAGPVTLWWEIEPPLETGQAFSVTVQYWDGTLTDRPVGRETWLPVPLLTETRWSLPAAVFGPVLRTFAWSVIVVDSTDGHPISGRSPEQTFTVDGRPPPPRVVAFASDRVNSFNIYLMDAEGGQQGPLAPRAAREREPAWSPDGTELAFTGATDISDLYHTQLFAMSWSGARHRMLLDAAPVAGPTWSSDGKSILFSVDQGLGGTLWQYFIDGREARLWPGFSPAWSPEGTRVACVQLHPGYWALSLLDASDPLAPARVVVTDAVSLLDDPAWSPDGLRLAYTAQPGTFHRVQAGESIPDVALLYGADPLSVAAANLLKPDSPLYRGQRLVIPTGPAKVYIVTADGSNPPAFITTGRAPCWSPDGKELLVMDWVTGQEGNPDNWEIFRVPLENPQARRNLTRHPANDIDPAWAPLTSPLYAPPQPVPPELVRRRVQPSLLEQVGIIGLLGSLIVLNGVPVWWFLRRRRTIILLQPPDGALISWRLPLRQRLHLRWQPDPSLAVNEVYQVRVAYQDWDPTRQKFGPWRKMDPQVTRQPFLLLPEHLAAPGRRRIEWSVNVVQAATEKPVGAGSPPWRFSLLVVGRSGRGERESSQGEKDEI